MSDRDARVNLESKLMKSRISKALGSDPLCLVLLASVVIATRITTLTQPLVERHDFRQTQTAYQTLTLSRGEGSLFHPKLPIFGSPWELPFEFPLFQIIAAKVHQIFGVSLDAANRGTSLFFFVLCLMPLFYLSRRIMSRGASFAVLVLFSFSPFALQWSRASLIEYCALFFALCYGHQTLKTWDQPSLLNALMSLVLGVTSGLVKATTLAPVMMFSAILILFHLGNPRSVFSNWRRLVCVSGPALASLIAARVWTQWADGIRLDNPATSWMSEEKLKPWMYGTLDQRRVIANWMVIFDRINLLLIGRFSLVAVLVIALLVPSVRARVASTLGAALVTISILFNLYVVHDYYLVAISALVVMSVGVSIDAVFQASSRSIRTGTAVFLVVLVPLSFTLVSERNYWTLTYKKFPTPVSELKQLSTPEQYAFTSYGGWNPLLLYYAERRGMMLDPRATTVEQLRQLPDLDRYDFYYGAPDRPEIIQIRGWYLPVASQTTRIDEDVAAFSLWGLAVGVNEPQNELFTNKRTVTCDGKYFFPLKKLPADITVKTYSSGTNSFQFPNGLQIVPVGGQIKILDQLDAEKFGGLSCTGDGTVTFEW